MTYFLLKDNQRPFIKIEENIWLNGKKEKLVLFTENKTWITGHKIVIENFSFEAVAEIKLILDPFMFCQGFLRIKNN